MSDERSIAMMPIGYVESCFTDPMPAEEMRGCPSRLVLRPEFQEALDGLEAGEGVVVVYYFHRSDGYALRRHPRDDKSQPLRGVFALRSQFRPNPIGVTVACIERVEANVLHVTGLDALDGTPLLDIKPYVPFFDSEDAVAGEQSSA